MQEVELKILWLHMQIFDKEQRKIKEVPKVLRSCNYFFFHYLSLGSVGKNLPAMKEDSGFIPGLERSPGGANGNPFQYSCLRNPMHREA